MQVSQPCCSHSPEAKILPSGLQATLKTSAWCPRQQLVCTLMHVAPSKRLCGSGLSSRLSYSTRLSAHLLPVIRKPRTTPNTNCFVFGCRCNQIRAPYRVKGQAKHSRGMSIGLLPVHAERMHGTSKATVVMPRPWILLLNELIAVLSPGAWRSHTRSVTLRRCNTCMICFACRAYTI